MHRNLKIVFCAVVALCCSAVRALAVAPATLDAVAALSGSYLDLAKAAAVGAAILGFGWVGYQLVKKYTSGAGQDLGGGDYDEYDYRTQENPDK